MSSRNSSDIFCLREDITDGTQMFSVNGSCPGKISRRRQLPESDCFEYGRTAAPRAEPIKEENEEAEDRRETAGYDRLVLDEDEDDDEDDAKVERSGKAPGPPAGDEPPARSRQEERRRTEQVVSASHMARNPLTGAGMEIKEHKRAKRGPAKKDEWLW